MSFLNSGIFNSNKNGIMCGNISDKNTITERNTSWNDWSDLYIQDNSANLFLSTDNSGGRVGIGLITPTEKLDVSGNVRIRGDISLNDGLFNNITISNLNNVNSTIISYLENVSSDIQTQINNKQDSLTFNAPSSNNTNPSTSAQIKTALDLKQDKQH